MEGRLKIEGRFFRVRINSYFSITKVMRQTKALLLLILCISAVRAFGRRWILPTTTGAEMWNISTWLTPYFIAFAEGVRDFFTKAQEIQNQWYLQAQASNAFSWLNPLNWFKKPSPPKPEGGIQSVGGFNVSGKLPEGVTKPSKYPPGSGFPKPLPTIGKPNIVKLT